MWIWPFDWGGALKKLFHFASSNATIVCDVVIPWSQTQVESKDVQRKPRDGQAVYLRSNQWYNYSNNNKKDKSFTNDIPQSYHSSIIPTSIIERPNSINHFSVSSVVSRHVDLTVWLGWCFEEALPLRFFQCNDSLWCGHTLITNSSWE